MLTETPLTPLERELCEALEWVANNSDYGSTHKIVAEAALQKAKDRTNG